MEEYHSQKQELTYLLETKHEEVMWNFYTGACGNSPPYLDIIFQDAIRLEALLALDDKPYLFGNDYNYLSNEVWNFEHRAMLEVLQRVSKINEPYENTYRYLLRNRMSFIVRQAEYERKQDSGLVHSPVWQVW